MGQEAKCTHNTYRTSELQDTLRKVPHPDGAGISQSDLSDSRSRSTKNHEIAEKYFQHPRIPPPPPTYAIARTIALLPTTFWATNASWSDLWIRLIGTVAVRKTQKKREQDYFGTVGCWKRRPFLLAMARMPYWNATCMFNRTHSIRDARKWSAQLQYTNDIDRDVLVKKQK